MGCFRPVGEPRDSGGNERSDAGANPDAGATPPKSCTIDGSQYADGALNPSNPCQRCRGAVSASSWTAGPDGVGCGRDGLCASGHCGPIACTMGSAHFLNRASNPDDPSLCCSVLNPGAWSPRFVDGGVFRGAGYGKSVTGDFNGDGFADVASADYENHRVLILLNQSGLLIPAGQYAVPDIDREIVAVDLNRDGFDDLVTDSAAPNSGGTLSILMSRGDGTFNRAVDLASCEGEFGSLQAGDFNGDGIPDLALACGLLFVGLGDGGFLPPTSFVIPGYPNGADYLATGDFNGDGRLDLAADSFSSGVVALTLGFGDGTFWLGSQYTPPTSSPFALASGDFDGDGIADLAAQSATNDNGPWRNQGVSFLKGKGDGDFDPPIWLPMGDGTPGGFAIVDLAGDGTKELVAANADHYIGQLTFGGQGARIAPEIQGPGSFMFYPMRGDFNRDGAEDVAVGLLDIGQPGSRIAVFLNGCP